MRKTGLVVVSFFVVLLFLLAQKPSMAYNECTIKITPVGVDECERCEDTEIIVESEAPPA